MSEDAKASERRYEKAVALQYDDLQELPHVIASGRGEIAKRIIAIAEEHKIPIHADTTLTDLLSTVASGHAITPETYELVAEVISFLYHVDKEWREKHGFLESVLGQG